MNRFVAVTNKEISQVIKQTVPKMHKEGDEVWFGSFNKKSFVFLTLLNSSMKSVKKFFCLQMKIKPKSCVTLFS